MISLERASIGLTVGMAAVAISAIRTPPKTWLSNWGMDVLRYIGWLVGVIFAAQIGAISAARLLDRFWLDASRMAREVIVLLSVVTAMYVVAIGAQVIANAVLFLQGERPDKIRWIRRFR
jgi:hypothetical protein